jgi:hypothetical protein
VKLTIRVPRDVGEGTRYAIVKVTGDPVPGEGGNVGAAVALGVTTLVEIANTSRTRAGVIQDLAVGETPPGAPIGLSARLRNTGNTHYGAPPFVVHASAQLRNGGGTMLATTRSILEGNSVVPTFERDFDLSLAPIQALAPGRYQVDVEVRLDDGTVLDRATAYFDLADGAVLPAVDTHPGDQGPPPLLIALLGALAGMAGLLVLLTPRLRSRRQASRKTSSG